MSSRTQQSNCILAECTVFLFALMFATLGKVGHHHWLVIVAAVCWLFVSAGVPSAFGGGLPVAGAVIVGLILAVVSFLAGAIFAATWTGAFVLACLSLIVMFIASRVTN